MGTADPPAKRAEEEKVSDPEEVFTSGDLAGILQLLKKGLRFDHIKTDLNSY